MEESKPTTGKLRRLPIAPLAAYAKSQKLELAVLFAYDGSACHTVTWGSSAFGCDQAAQIGERLEAHLRDGPVPPKIPSRLRAAQRRVKELDAEVGRLKDQIRRASAALIGLAEATEAARRHRHQSRLG